jgi:hypothetical protein
VSILTRKQREEKRPPRLTKVLSVSIEQSGKVKGVRRGKESRLQRVSCSLMTGSIGLTPSIFGDSEIHG